MRRYVKFLVCGAAAALVLASGCGQKQEEETTAAQEETSGREELTGHVELGQYKGIEIEADFFLQFIVPEMEQIPRLGGPPGENNDGHVVKDVKPIQR